MWKGRGGGGRDGQQAMCRRSDASRQCESSHQSVFMIESGWAKNRVEIAEIGLKLFDRFIFILITGNIGLKH